MELTAEQKELKKELAKYKRKVVELAGEVHDIVEDSIWTDYVRLPKLSEDIDSAMNNTEEDMDESKLFNFQDVIDGIYEKLIRRHPHVFKDALVHSSRDVEVQWEDIKRNEKKNKNSRERSRISPATWRNPVDQHSQRQYTPLRPAPQNPAFHGSGVRTERQQHL
jgi:NTP pyrophosphatase (non-canonical NTP hydrolase)